MGENPEYTAEELAKAAKPKLLENAYAEVFAKTGADHEPYTDLVTSSFKVIKKVNFGHTFMKILHWHDFCFKVLFINS